MRSHLPFALCLILPLAALYDLSATIPWPIIIAYTALISTFTFASYWSDKRRAQKDLWRIPENSLHIFELLGGWPAAYLAQRRLRHKTSKQSYRIVFWLIVALHQLLALEWLTNWRISRAAWALLS